MPVKAIVVDEVPKSVSFCGFAKDVYKFSSILDGTELVEFTCDFLDGSRRNVMTLEYFKNCRCVLCKLMTHNQYLTRYGAERKRD